MKRYRYYILSGVAVVFGILLFIAYRYFNKPTVILFNENPVVEKYDYLSKSQVDTWVDFTLSKFEEIDYEIQFAKDEPMSWEDAVSRQNEKLTLKNSRPNQLPIDDDFTLIIKLTQKSQHARVLVPVKAEVSKSAYIEVYHFDKLIEENDSIRMSSDFDAEFKYLGLTPYFSEEPKHVDCSIDTELNMSNPGTYPVQIFITEDPSITFNFSVIVPKKEIEEPIVKDPETSTQPDKGKPGVSGNSGDVVVSDAHSLSVLVNKTRRLPDGFVPKLREVPNHYAVDHGYRAHPEAVQAFMALVDALENETGKRVLVTSSYRPYESQQRIFDQYVSEIGYEKTLQLASRPGFSEHQTGLSIDVTVPGGNMFDFGNTEESVWLANNAHRFGFIIRYPKGKESITGYQYEPWHIRYLGKGLATKVHDSGLTYEEYWNKYLK